MKLQQYEAHKDPDSVLDYGRNWGDAPDGTPGFLAMGEQIVVSTWKITADKEKTPTLEIADEGAGINADRSITSVFLKGGTSGIAYKLTNSILTVDGDSLNRLEENWNHFLL